MFQCPQVVLTWGMAHDPYGLKYCISADGREWEPSQSVRILREVPVMGRYQGPRTAQVDEKTLATVCLSEMGGVFVVLVDLDDLANSN